LLLLLLRGHAARKNKGSARPLDGGGGERRGKSRLDEGSGGYPPEKPSLLHRVALTQIQTLLEHIEGGEGFLYLGVEGGKVVAEVGAELLERGHLILQTGQAGAEAVDLLTEVAKDLVDEEVGSIVDGVGGRRRRWWGRGDEAGSLRGGWRMLGGLGHAIMFRAHANATSAGLSTGAFLSGCRADDAVFGLSTPGPFADRLFGGLVVEVRGDVLPIAVVDDELFLVVGQVGFGCRGGRGGGVGAVHLLLCSPYADFLPNSFRLERFPLVVGKNTTPKTATGKKPVISSLYIPSTTTTQDEP
jgi:hypothetical protein